MALPHFGFWPCITWWVWKKPLMRKMVKNHAQKCPFWPENSRFVASLVMVYHVKWSLCLSGMSIQDKFVNVHWTRVTVNSQESLHICIFPHLDPSFLKSYQATSKQNEWKTGNPFPAELQNFTKSTRWKSIKKTREEPLIVSVIISVIICCCQEAILAWN